MPWPAWLSCTMGDAKLIQLRPITAALARATIAKHHYSGKVVQNSQLHVGVYYEGKLEGAIQLGPPMQRSNLQGLVAGCTWNSFMEINRMAFSPALPKNSESRALGVLMRLLKQKRPDITWLISFADGTQCGDGTIYRAAGFLLTGIKPNTGMVRMPDGTVHTQLGLRAGMKNRRALVAKYRLNDQGQAPTALFKPIGAVAIPGFMLRYVYLLDPALRSKLTCPVLPYSAIARAGAQMYKGRKRAVSIGVDAPALQAGESGSRPTTALQPLLKNEG